MKIRFPLHIAILSLIVVICLIQCSEPNIIPDPDPLPEVTDSTQVKPDTTQIDPDTTIFDVDTTFHAVSIHSSVNAIQPMTGLVLWPERAKELDKTYRNSISMEFSYCLPCKVVKGKNNGQIDYDWTSFDNLLADIASRGHQAIVRFRYEYPSGTDVDGKKGTTAVPEYIKALSDYKETYSANPGGDGPTYYADWSNTELQWFTKQFYSDFNARYGSDNRIAFLEVGFGHWSEYHIYGTKLELGRNFPSKAYQKEFFLHLSQVMDIPWLVSVDVADTYYSPFTEESALSALSFGLFDDSFMHSEHELWQGDGYNETCWNGIGKNTRWQVGVCGGEISYYTSKDQREFLNPAGLYGVTWEEASAKYHLSFIIANDAPQGPYGTAERFLQAGMASGYHLKVTDCRTNAKKTIITVTNTGIAPLYKDAYFAIDSSRSTQSLKGLLPNQTREIIIPQELVNPDDLYIVSDYLLDGQQIQFDGNN